jgi:hypothetical protein
MSVDNIVFGFSRPITSYLPPPFFAWAIMLVDGSNFSHSYIRFHSDSYDRDLVYQASGLRVNFIGLPLFQSQEVIVKEFTIPVSEATKMKVVQFAIDNVGIPYSLGAALGILAVKIAALAGRKIKNPISQQGYFCSELAAIILEDYLGADFTSDQVKCMTPTDVYNYLSQHPKLQS